MANVRPDIESGHQDEDEQQLGDHDSLGQVQIHSWGVIVLSVNGANLRVLLLQEVTVLVKGLLVAARVAGIMEHEWRKTYICKY